MRHAESLSPGSRKALVVAAAALLAALPAASQDLTGLARQARDSVVLLTEALSFVADHLAEHLGPIEHVLANRLEIKSDLATGRLLDPVVGGFEAGRWVRSFAEERGLDLGRSRAYASKGPDLMLLTAVGEPCAVNPDFTLRRAAKEADWPVVYYDA